MKNLAHGAFATALVALAPALAAGQADPPRLPGVPVDELKMLYLACNEAATQRLLGAGEAAQCSVVYEELKQRAFGGEFDKLLAWSRTQTNVHRTRR